MVLVAPKAFQRAKCLVWKEQRYIQAQSYLKYYPVGRCEFGGSITLKTLMDNHILFTKRYSSNTTDAEVYIN